MVSFMEQRNKSKMGRKHSLNRLLKINGVYRLSKFYISAYFITFFLLLPARMYLGANDGPPTLMFRLTEWTVLAPSLGALVFLGGSSKSKKTGRRSQFSKIALFTMLSCVFVYSLILTLGLISDGVVPLGIFIVSLLGLFIVSYFTALFFIIFNAKRINDSFRKRYEIFTFLVACAAILMTVLASHDQASVKVSAILNGLAAILVVLAAPIQLAKLTHEFCQIPTPSGSDG